MIEETQDIINTITPIIVTYGLDVIGAMLILIAGWIVANWLSRRVFNLVFNSDKIDPSLAPIIRKIVRFAILIITLLAVLGQFGVQTASLIAVLGAATLAIGLALQGTLSNVAAGVMILSFRPFNIDDFISVGGTSGTVTEIGLFVSRLKTVDGLAVILPNSKIWGDVITNFSRNDTRRLDLTVGISYSDDMNKAIQIVKDILDNDERVLKDPAPLVAISELGDSSVNILARPWSHRSDFWQMKWDLTKRVKEEFDKNDISIPFPQRDVHLFQQNPKN
jgi:small conductance mechanosensitive channel